MTLVVHTAYDDRRLWIWAEQTPTPPSIQRPARGRRPARHPFAADKDALVAQIEASVAERSVASSTASVWLPSVPATPLPSTPLLAEAPTREATPSQVDLRPWRVDCLRLELGDALGWLAACRERTLLDHGVLLGSSARFMAEVGTFAATLVAGRRVLPGLAREGTSWRARWQPLLGADERRTLRHLAETMPGAARALIQHSTEQPPMRAPATMLRELLAGLVDALVRSAASERPAVRRSASLHDRWLAALTSKDGRLASGEHDDLALFAAQIDRWRAPLALIEEAPYRLCVRLEPPSSAAVETSEAAGAPWQLRYFVQSAEDPSLMVPTDAIWTRRRRSLAAAALSRDRRAIREFTLASLARAAAICPAIAESLANAQPKGHLLDVHAAHAFLREHASELRAAGFGVLLPSWWTRNKPRLRVGVFVPNQALDRHGSLLNREQLLHFDWQLALGDLRVDARELDRLARAKEPLVLVRGRWIEVDDQTLRAAKQLLDARESGRKSARELMLLAIGAHDGPPGLELASVVAEGELGRLIERFRQTTQLELLPPPVGLEANLRPYQRRGLSWLAFLGELGFGACLADDMGLGKTIQTLALIQHRREAGEARPTLLICPTSVIQNWQREAERFTPELSVLVHHGQARERRGVAALARQHALVVTSYGLLVRDLDSFAAIEWAALVLDEAQNIKNPRTRQARAARALHADQRIALTGTPVENHLGDLWALLDFLNPSLLGTDEEFRRRFASAIQVRHDAAATERLRRITGPFILRRLKTDRSIIDELPDKIEAKLYCNLGKEQVALYRTVLRELDEGLVDAEGIRRKGIILAALTKLKQICDHPALFLADGSSLRGRSGKLVRLTEMLQDVLAMNEHALIFTQFAEMGHLLVRHLQDALGHETLFLHGGVPKPKRDAMVERFSAGLAPLFVLSLKAGGTGLNLTRANHVFHFDRWWNPAVENQATDRAFRIGQTRNVQVHKFVCAGTLEETIDAMIESKRELANNVVEAGEGWLTSLSNEAIRSALALRTEAME